MNYIDPKRVTWGGNTYSALPINCTMSTSISGTITADRIAEEIDRKLKQIEKEHTMEPEKKIYVDISPGKSAYVKYMDHIIKINNTREFNIMHERVGEPLAIELICDSVDVQRTNMPDPKIYEAPKMKPYMKRSAKPIPKKVIFSGPATTILWKDGTKTTVKCSSEDVWDDDVGIAMCYLKKMLGNKGNFNNIFREAAKVAEPQQRVCSTNVLEGKVAYNSSLNDLKGKIDHMNTTMKEVASTLNKSLEGEK